jgi:hypothetical protein
MEQFEKVSKCYLEYFKDTTDWDIKYNDLNIMCHKLKRYYLLLHLISGRVDIICLASVITCNPLPLLEATIKYNDRIFFHKSIWNK